MSNYSATIYSFAFHDPKALHPLVVANWATVKCAKFVILTDRVPAWKTILPENTKNIHIHHIDLEELFRRSFPLFEVDGYTEFRNKRSWLFNPVAFVMNGYLGCQLRPALSTLFPQKRTKFWGWADNDVLIDATRLEAHILDLDTQLALYPEKGLMWEQFKLFSSEINTTMWYKDLIDYFIEKDEPTLSPLEARFAYHMKDMGRFTYDKVDQSLIAIHWAYSDRLAVEHGRLPNQYDVILKRDMSLVGADGQQTIFFNCDNQVKRFKDAEAAEINAALDSDGQYTFVHEPWL